jgi:hypothetical protein
MRRPSGNGETKFSIGQADMGGWVRVFLESGHPPDDLPIFLSQSLTEWFRMRSHLHLKCIIPICRDGNTVELNAWYEAHLFPPTAEAPKANPAAEQ